MAFMFTLLSEKVDIAQMPLKDFKAIDELANLPAGNGEFAEITLGDMHANGLKLIYALIRHKVFTGLNKNDYAELLRIYNLSALEVKKTDLESFNTILKKARVDKAIGLRFIGDILADRGSNDYFILKILEKLCKKKVQFEVLLSNHDAEFIEVFEKTSERLHAPNIDASQAISISNLQTLIDRNLVSRKEINRLYENVYKPSLKLVSYSLLDDDKTIMIYSHAGIGLNTIKQLAKTFHIEYEDDTCEALAQTIDKINEVFKRYIDNNQMHSLWQLDMDDSYSEPNPFYFLMTNRMYGSLERPESKGASDKKYYLKFVHGHDNLEKSDRNIINLENDLGKDSNVMQGLYEIIFSLAESLRHRLQKQQDGFCSDDERSSCSSAGSVGSSSGSDSDSDSPPQARKAIQVVPPSPVEYMHTILWAGKTSSNSTPKVKLAPDPYEIEERQLCSEEPIGHSPVHLLLQAIDGISISNNENQEAIAFKKFLTKFAHELDKELNARRYNCYPTDEADVIKLIEATRQLLQDMKDLKERQASMEPQSYQQAAERLVNRYQSTCQSSRLTKFFKGIAVIAMTALGLLLGATIGVALGIALGVWTGPGAAFLAVAGLVTGAQSGAALILAMGIGTTGLVSGALTAHGLFKSSKQDRQVDHIAQQTLNYLHHGSRAINAT